MARMKYVMLLPLTYNDSSTVPKEVRDQIEDEIYLFSGGFRYGATGRDAYRMKTGEKQVDITQEAWIAIDESEEPGLRALVSRFAALLGQETMYLERTGGTVEFIPPPAEEE